MKENYVIAFLVCSWLELLILLFFMIVSCKIFLLIPYLRSSRIKNNNTLFHLNSCYFSSSQLIGVSDLAFSKDGSLFTHSGFDGCVFYWDSVIF